MDLWAEMDGLEYMFLRRIDEPEDNVLRLVVEEGRAGSELQDLRLGRVVVAGVQEISSSAGCAAYEVLFPKYLAYSVRNESFTVADHEERYEGKRCRLYSESKFLSYVRQATFAADDYLGPCRHYGLVCENHVVDVATTGPPRVARIERAG